MAAAEADARPFLSGIVLAAGAATRMGRPKQLLPLEDRPLLQHVVDAAGASRLDEIIVVLGSHAAEIRQAIQLPAVALFVVNPDHAEGQSTSLRAGLRAASSRAAAAAVLLGDQPHVGSALIDRVAAAFLAADAPIVRPVYHDAAGRLVPGHPVFLARRIWPDVERLHGDQGARALLVAHPNWLDEIAFDGPPPIDVDTLGDYQRVVDAAQASRIKPSAQIDPKRR